MSAILSWAPTVEVLSAEETWHPAVVEANEANGLRVRFRDASSSSSVPHHLVRPLWAPSVEVHDDKSNQWRQATVEGPRPAFMGEASIDVVFQDGTRARGVPHEQVRRIWAPSADLLSPESGQWFPVTVQQSCEKALVAVFECGAVSAPLLRQDLPGKIRVRSAKSTISGSLKAKASLEPLDTDA